MKINKTRSYFVGWLVGWLVSLFVFCLFSKNFIGQENKSAKVIFC